MEHIKKVKIIVIKVANEHADRDQQIHLTPLAMQLYVRTSCAWPQRHVHKHDIGMCEWSFRRFTYGAKRHCVKTPAGTSPTGSKVHPYPVDGFREQLYTLSLQRIGGLKLTYSSEKTDQTDIEIRVHHETQPFEKKYVQVSMKRSQSSSHHRSGIPTNTCPSRNEAILDKAGNHQHEMEPRAAPKSEQDLQGTHQVRNKPFLDKSTCKSAWSAAKAAPIKRQVFQGTLHQRGSRSKPPCIKNSHGIPCFQNWWPKPFGPKDSFGYPTAFMLSSLFHQEFPRFTSTQPHITARPSFRSPSSSMTTLDPQTTRTCSCFPKASPDSPQPNCYPFVMCLRDTFLKTTRSIFDPILKLNWEYFCTDRHVSHRKFTHGNLVTTSPSSKWWGSLNFERHVFCKAEQINLPIIHRITQFGRSDGRCVQRAGT